MALVHAVIGLGEALITGAVVRFLLVRRPDLFDEPDAAAERFRGGQELGPGDPGRSGSRAGDRGLPGAVCLRPARRPRVRRREARMSCAEDEAAPKIPAPIPDYQASDRRCRACEARDGRGGGRRHAAWSLASHSGWRGSCPGRSRSRHTPMRLEPLERRRERTGLLHRLDARLKLIAALAFVVVAVAAPIGSWTWLRSRGICAGACDRPFGHSAARPGPALV